MKAIFEVTFVTQANALVEALCENGYEVDVKPIFIYENTPSERVVRYKVEVSKDESHIGD